MSYNIVFAIITWAISLIWLTMSVIAFSKKKPINFWAGDYMKPDEIVDVTAYNRANGVMWLVFGLMFVVAGVVEIVWHEYLGMLLLLLLCVPGFLVLMLCYQFIHLRYQCCFIRPSGNYRRCQYRFV